MVRPSPLASRRPGTCPRAECRPRPNKRAGSGWTGGFSRWRLRQSTYQWFVASWTIQVRSDRGAAMQAKTMTPWCEPPRLAPRRAGYMTLRLWLPDLERLSDRLARREIAMKSPSNIPRRICGGTDQGSPRARAFAINWHSRLYTGKLPPEEGAVSKPVVIRPPAPSISTARPCIRKSTASSARIPGTCRPWRPSGSKPLVFLSDRT